MGISAEIKSMRNSLTNAEGTLADYILQNKEQVSRMSIYQLAETVNVSVPTVTRLTKKVGYSGYRDFKFNLVSEVAVSPKNKWVDESDANSTLIDKVFIENIQNLQDTLSLLDTTDFIAFCNQLIKARRIIFFGLGASNLVARYAALRFSHMDFQAEAYDDPLMMMLNAKRMDKKCVAIGISHSGETAITIKAIEIAKRNGAVTAGISNYINSPLSVACDHLFCTAYAENKVSAVALSSHIAQLAIIDAMYLLLAKNGKRNWNIREIDDTIAELLRV